MLDAEESDWEPETDSKEQIAKPPRKRNGSTCPRMLFPKRKKSYDLSILTPTECQADNNAILNNDNTMTTHHELIEADGATSDSEVGVDLSVDVGSSSSTLPTMESQITFLKTTCLEINGDSNIAVKWLLAWEFLLVPQRLTTTVYQFFGNKDPELLKKLFLHNVAILDHIPWNTLEPKFPPHTSEIDIRNRIKEVTRTYYALHHSATVVFFTKHRILTHEVKQIPPFEDHVASEKNPAWKPDQELLDFFYRVAESRSLRRDKHGFVYEPLYLPNGIHTFFYKKVCTVKEFMEGAIMPPEAYPNEYAIFTDKASTPNHVLNLLSSLPDLRFPMLEKNMSLFAFNNGIINFETMEFYAYDTCKLATGVKTRSLTKTIEDLPAGSVCCHYIDSMVDISLWPNKEQKQAARQEECRNNGIPISRRFPYEAKRLVEEIKKLSINAIFQAQKYQDDDIFYCCATLGRALSHLNDNKQVAPYYRGVAGTGKSTLLKLLMMMRDKEDVGLLMEDGRKTFGDMHLYDKELNVALDIGKNPTFSKTRLNNYISKEDITVDILYSRSVQSACKANWIFASNNQIPWTDVSGGLARRFIIWVFDQLILSTDSTLFDRCVGELANLFVLWGLCYRLFRKIIGTKSVWDKDDEGNRFLPERVYKARQSYLASCSSLSLFLEDPEYCRTSKTDDTVTPADIAAVQAVNKKLHYFQRYQKTSLSSIDPVEDIPLLNAFGVHYEADIQGKSKGHLSGLQLRDG